MVKKVKVGKGSKLFVLDTNVLIYDPSSLFRFKDNDVFIPMTTLEELDSKKQGQSDVARSCRHASRTLDEIVSRKDLVDIKEGYELDFYNGGHAKGRLFLQSEKMQAELPVELPSHKGDNEILRVTCALKLRFPDRDVILVSRDINLRIKAKALQVIAEDYWNDTVVEDADLLYTGMVEIDEKFWDKNEVISSSKIRNHSILTVKGPDCAKLLPNMLLHGEDSNGLFNARVTEKNEDTVVLQTLTDYESSKNTVYGIHAKNLEQSFALNLLLDPEVQLVTILGQAGSGKTLLTIAAGLDLLFEEKKQTEMIFTRITVPVGEDIGFLPGGEEEKLMPWMGALDDNLEFLANSSGTDDSGSWGKKVTKDVLMSKIKVKAVSFMRGRTFLNKILVIDEAQNLTPKQMKTLITRAGAGTKVICLGNLAQIDAPYLTESSCGLSYLVEKMKGWKHYGHVTLARVERSPLADYASSVL